jgi:hypothetical protein
VLLEEVPEQRSGIALPSQVEVLRVDGFARVNVRQATAKPLEAVNDWLQFFKQPVPSFNCKRMMASTESHLPVSLAGEIIPTDMGRLSKHPITDVLEAASGWLVRGEVLLAEASPNPA